MAPAFYQSSDSTNSTIPIPFYTQSPILSYPAIPICQKQLKSAQIKKDIASNRRRRKQKILTTCCWRSSSSSSSSSWSKTKLRLLLLWSHSSSSSSLLHLCYPLLSFVIPLSVFRGLVFLYIVYVLTVFFFETNVVVYLSVCLSICLSVSVFV